MNDITILGRLAEDAKGFTVKTEEGESLLISFRLLDYGTPGQKNQIQKNGPLSMEVHFLREPGSKLLTDLVKDKEVLVHGFMVRKDYVTKNGDERSKIYISALVVQFTGCNENKEGEVA